MPMISRRGLFALGSAGLLLPRRLFAAKSGERKFLFVFNPGGWDPLLVFAPIFNDNVDHLQGDTAASAGGFDIVDGPNRPSVRSFFKSWGSKTCLINGMMIPSVAHDVCVRLTMTADSRGAQDDWVSIIAGNGQDRLMPNVHVSGPLYPLKYADASVRVGLSGQLPALVTGEALSSQVSPPALPSSEVEALEEAWIRRRVDAWTAAAKPGIAARIGAKEQLALERAAQLPDVADALTMGASNGLYAAASVAVRALSAGLSRTGIVGYGVGGNGQWDTHAGNTLQDGYFEELFDVLGRVVGDLDAAPGEGGGTMLDETTVVVLSEMGRAPQANAAGGKDHWTWTSAMLIGSGVAGGRTIGGWTEELTGDPIDLITGEVSDSGETMYPGHLGATLLALADVDPGEFVDRSMGTVIEGALD
jgi:uncharacterized protein (DUF1501 family)